LGEAKPNKNAKIRGPSRTSKKKVLKDGHKKRKRKREGKAIHEQRNQIMKSPVSSKKP